MSNQSRPGQFATYSYYLAFVSSGIMLIAFVAQLLNLRVIFNIVWLSLITGAVGTFFAMAARSDFKRVGATEEDEARARVGLRINLAATIFMLIVVVFAIVASALPGMN